MGNNGFNNKFNELIDILEAICIKSLNKRIIRGSKLECYKNLDIQDLITKFDTKYNDNKFYLENKLKSSDYTKDSLICEDELDGLGQKIIDLKNKCHPNYKNYFKKAENLLNKIKIKNQEISDGFMRIDVLDESKPQENSNFWQQKKLQLDKQKVIQAQDLALLNDNFGRALASLECYANRYAGRKLSNYFDYYNMFNLGNTQQLDELKKKAFVQTQLFKLSYDDYIKNYSKYDPPNNINLQEIKSLLGKWMYYVDEESKIIYQGMINVICSLNNSVFDKKFRATSQKYKHARMDPKKISSFAAGVYYYNHQRCQEAKYNYMQNGKIISSLNINKNYKSDKNAENLLKYYKNNQLNIQNRDEDDYK